MTPVELSRTVLRAVRRAVDDGELSVAVPERAVVAPPGPGGCGDYATNIALQLARPAGQPPLRVAEVLRPHLLRTGAIADVVVTGPGFLNISLRSTAPVALVHEILRSGILYGHSDALAGQCFRLAAPDEVRAVVHVDVLARLLRSQGAVVRIECESGRPRPWPRAEWVAVLGLRLGESRPAPGECADEPSPAETTLTLRPVPAPTTPLPLGRDAARWALLHPAPHDPPRITPEHLSQREGNPLFRVRYAHARTRALLRNAADLGFTPEPGLHTGPENGPEPGPDNGLHTGPEPAPEPGPDNGLHTGPEPAPETGTPETGKGNGPQLTLLTALADHPRILTAAATHRAPDRLARHLVTVADALQPLLPTVLPLGAEKPSAAHRARLALAEAAGTVLAGGLSLLGIDAPDHL
ncbi:ArgS-related anticodon-binding protein NrtL [Streptomyces sp. NPDC052012]|uniref:ArgS-related anticodon-binding protein NrtL n=1 Tax=Streptomyces sp. NPDC052012 TaxID=3155051 RepID=UPI00344DA344